MREEFTEEEKKVINRFRNTEVYKFENQSDFKSLRQCYKVAKELYECLKYFDSRSSRFQPVFNSYNDRFHKYNRSRIYPQEYFLFKFFSVEITLWKKGNDFFIGVQGFRPWSEPILDSGEFYKINNTKNFSEAKVLFLKIIAEFIDRYLNGDLKKIGM